MNEIETASNQQIELDGRSFVRTLPTGRLAIGLHSLGPDEVVQLAGYLDHWLRTGPLFKSDYTNGDFH